MIIMCYMAGGDWVFVCCTVFKLAQTLNMESVSMCCLLMTQWKVSLGTSSVIIYYFTSMVNWSLVTITVVYEMLFIIKTSESERLSPWLHLVISEMWCWSGGRKILTELSLCYSTVYYYNGTQRYEQFLQVSRLYCGLWSHLVCDPTIRQPGFDLPRQQWSLLNHFRTEQGHCSACRKKWRLTDADLCFCGETQTMSHIVESFPLTKLNGGLSRLHSADDDTVSWLTSYG